MAILILSQVSSIFGLPFFFHMRENLGFKETFLGSLISLGWIGVMVTTVFYAKWLSKCEPKRILEWAVLLNAVNIFSTLLIRDEKTALLLVFFGGVLGCLTLLPIMSVSAVLTHRSGVEGTLFAVLMSVHNLGQIGFGFLGGKIYHVVGLYTLIIGAGLASLACLLIVRQLRFVHKVTLPPEPQGPFSTGPAATPHEPE
jgi:predicted MFS family arabinose efflux permease